MKLIRYSLIVYSMLMYAHGAGNGSFSSRASTVGVADEDRDILEPPFMDRDSKLRGRFKPCSFSPSYYWRDYPFSQNSYRRANTLSLAGNDNVDQLRLSDLWDRNGSCPVAGIRRFICEGGVRLEGLKEMQGEYGFHFHGCPSADLGGIKSILGRGFFLKHIDVAYRTPDGPTRDAIFGVVLELLDDPCCENLETLSLRFLGIDDQQLIKLRDKLITKPRKVQRLVLSFNGISDDVLVQGGVVERLIKDVGKLPNLKGIDLKGNKLQQSNKWDLISAFTQRSLACRRSGGFSGYFRLGMNDLPPNVEEQTTFADKTIVNYQPMVDASFVQTVKNFMNN